MDFMTVALANGHRVRVLTVLDLFTRASIAIRANARFSSGQVVNVLEEVSRLRGVPKSLRVDNGPEFTGKMLDLWAYFNKVTLDFSRPGKPTDNAFIESFNGRLRQECIDSHWFLCQDELRTRLESWRNEYNQERPHSALGNLAPEEFASSLARTKEPDRMLQLA
jgi:putative transposase